MELDYKAIGKRVKIARIKACLLYTSVLIGVVQNFRRGLGEQPVLKFFLLCKHFLIQGGVQFFVCHVVHLQSK